MKITEIVPTKVVVPMRPDTTNSVEFGERPFQWEPIFILQVYTDEGIVGLGETPRNVPRSSVEEGIELLLGKDPLQINLQELSLPGEHDPVRLSASRFDLHMRSPELSSLHGNRAYKGFEMALCDLVGKALGVPVYDLLGGAYRDRVWTSYWTGTRTPDDLVRIARLARSKGFGVLKHKSRWGEPYCEQMQALADSVPEMRIISDFNTDLQRPVEAARLARKVARYDHIAVWEDPVPKWDLRWYALLRTQIGIAIALHLGDPVDVIRAIVAEAMDYVNLAGGLFSFVKAANIAEVAGVPCWHGGGLELGIGGMSHAHACAAAKGCILPSHLVGSFLREDDLIVNPILFENGYVIVPKEPGLGVELDTKALERYRVE